MEISADIIETREAIRKLIYGMPTRFNRDAAKNLAAVIQFEIFGDAGGAFAITIENQEATVQDGTHAHPNLTFSLSDATYIDIALGKLSGPQAFFQRKVRFDGELSLVMKMHSLFPSLKL